MGTTTRDSASCFPLVSLPPFLPTLVNRAYFSCPSLAPPRTVLSGGKSGGLAEWRPSLHCFRISCKSGPGHLGSRRKFQLFRGLTDEKCAPL